MNEFNVNKKKIENWFDISSKIFLKINEYINKISNIQSMDINNIIKILNNFWTELNAINKNKFIIQCINKNIKNKKKCIEKYCKDSDQIINFLEMN